MPRLHHRSQAVHEVFVLTTVVQRLGYLADVVIVGRYLRRRPQHGRVARYNGPSVWGQNGACYR